ncbi:hypothetical protein Pcinc_035024 [Petrolisthes cinctipes]|uniref:Uncharacterized protein n=1 Tax=Petrolisthes cinctipes TaxID=88211 RepID=A0AAE1BXN2_PETCI|nr:hypothetical protein Pcinc_035024 [Petrolisthes cinctipes]
MGRPLNKTATDSPQQSTPRSPPSTSTRCKQSYVCVPYSSAGSRRGAGAGAGAGAVGHQRGGGAGTNETKDPITGPKMKTTRPFNAKSAPAISKLRLLIRLRAGMEQASQQQQQQHHHQRTEASEVVVRAVPSLQGRVASGGGWWWVEEWWKDRWRQNIHC